MSPSPSLASLLASSPSLDLPCSKHAAPALLLCLPSSLASLLSRLLLLLLPAPKPRRLLLVGGYLYKFDPSTSALKGTPIPLGSVSASPSPHPLSSVPCARLRVSSPSASKTRYYSFASAEDLSLFLSTLAARKAEQIKRDMGHSRVEDPSWKRADARAGQLVSRKGRIAGMLSRREREGGDFEETVGLLR
ncbi:hypothetical protein TeGR_g8770 [Tetraparma gracilis]|uniref:Uncharacterized protein n=1 Tax=Tetraparma gracilis TaxID=2962635 RepID=A0ABQ6N0B0_9STRA|nr:hypothetical protein TeGR_g8770 [Tetraparma gracilis]